MGWYYDEACTDGKEADAKNLDLSYATDGSITLYAKWSDVYNIYFETSSPDEYIPKAEYHFGDKVKLSDLRVPKNMERGGVSAPFKYWKNEAEDVAVTKDFNMPPNDVYLKAVYDTGMSNQFNLEEEGFVSNLGSDKKAFSDIRGAYNEETGTYASAELTDGKAMSFDVTLSFDSYGQDAGAVFAANAYINGTFDSPMFFYITSTAANAANFGSIQIWGPTVKVNKDGTETVTVDQELKMLRISDVIFEGSEYLAKINACRESGEPATFTYTVRKCGDNWIIGVDGVEYVSIKAGDDAKSGGKVVAVNAGYCGIVTKTDQIYYKNVKLVDADKAEIAFDAGEGATIDETERKVTWGEAVGTLPVPTREGLTFLGWYYYEGATLKRLTDTTTFASDSWRITAFAEWDDPTAQHYNIVFDGGEGGYTHAAIENWYEGKQHITLPKPERHLFYTYDGEWYYDAECTQPVDERNISAATATGDGEIKTLTLYGKATYSKFSNEEWSEDENGNITGSGVTFVDGTELVVGKTFSANITLPSFGTTYGNTYLYIGSSDVKVAQYQVIILGTNGSNVKNNTNGAIQLYEYTDGSYKFLGSAYSTRYYLGALAGTSYNTGYEAYKTSGESFTFTVSVAAAADKTYFFVNGNLLYTVNKAVSGKYSGVGVATANTSAFSALKAEDSKATITFDADGGTLVGDATRTVAAGSALGTLPEVTKAGFRLLGWFDGNTAVTAETVIGANVMNKTLVAKWVEQVSVTLNVNGGDALEKTEYVIDKDSALTLPVPTRAGYTFLGWFDSADAKVESGATFAASATLTAKWEQKVTVTFDPKEGTVAETTRLIDKGAALGELPVPTRPEYAFLGWFDGDTQVTAESTFTANVTLVAKWESAPTHTIITVKYDDGVTPDGTIDLNVGTAIGSQLPTPTRDGYRLDGWKDNGGNVVTAESTFSTSTATITAQWVKVWNVAFNAGSGIELSAANVVVDDGAQLETLATITSANYMLVGWFNGETRYTETTVISEDVTLTAVYFTTDGTSALINDVDELKLLSKHHKLLSSKSFKLTSDLNLTGQTFTSIGDSTGAFVGTFDGDNHTVSGLKTPLFGYIKKATIKNLKISVTVESTAKNVGGLANVVTGAENAGLLSTILSVEVSGSVKGGEGTGGFFGYVDAYLNVTDCTNRANVESSANFVGGIIGSHNSSSAKERRINISGCANYGNVSSTGLYVGGIIGIARQTTNSTIQNCKNFGNISGKGSVGGIAGANRIAVKECYCLSTATITIGTTAKSAESMTVVGGYILGTNDKGNGGTIDEASCGLCDADGTAI